MHRGWTDECNGHFQYPGEHNQKGNFEKIALLPGTDYTYPEVSLLGWFKESGYFIFHLIYSNINHTITVAFYPHK